MVAEVQCPGPNCGHVIALIHLGPGGRLSVEHRSPQIAEGGDHLDRPFRPWEVTTWRATGGSWAGVECVCKDTGSCGAIFVLERRRVVELAKRAASRGAGSDGDPARPTSHDLTGCGRPSTSTACRRPPTGLQL